MTHDTDTDAFAIPAHTECDCGQTLHITVHLNSAHLEQVVERVARKVWADEVRRSSPSMRPRTRA